MTESNTEFLARMREYDPSYWSREDALRLVMLAEERVMIEERRLAVATWRNEWLCSLPGKFTEASQDLSTAIRSVVAKI